MAKKTNRRIFVAQAGKLCLASAFIAKPLQVLASTGTTKPQPLPLETPIGWSQSPLPYAFTALEPAIDSKTMEIHYTHHAAGYAKNLEKALIDEKVDSSKLSIEALLKGISGYSTTMRNNAGGHFNHELFWKSLRAPKTVNQPGGVLLELIRKKYSSFESFKTTFTESAMGKFGSGWAWLTCTKDLELEITTTSNQDNPLMDKSGSEKLIVFGLDVWEHAYYLNYQNRRKDYITNWWSIVNWEYAESRIVRP
jgi:Fe-Mn family superoxide dismutase